MKVYSNKINKFNKNSISPKANNSFQIHNYLILKNKLIRNNYLRIILSLILVKMHNSQIYFLKKKLKMAQAIFNFPKLTRAKISLIKTIQINFPKMKKAKISLIKTIVINNNKNLQNNNKMIN